jgi:D-alanyl-D-alanine carboxypeptidase
VGLLPKRKPVRVEALLYGLLLPSGNDAAHALADKVAGGSRSFVESMNAQAQKMSLGCTHYTSPDGFIDAGNHSCAVDLAALARAVLDRPRLARIVGSRSAVLKFPTKGGKLYLFNNNPLLRTGYAGTIGVKTGYTDAAGRCLVAAVRRHGHRLGVVLLHSVDPGLQARKLFTRGFRALG